MPIFCCLFLSTSCAVSSVFFAALIGLNIHFYCNQSHYTDTLFGLCQLHEMYDITAHAVSTGRDIALKQNYKYLRIDIVLHNATLNLELNRFLRNIFPEHLAITTYEFLPSEENSVNGNLIPYTAARLLFRYSSLVERGAKNRNAAGSNKAKKRRDTRTSRKIRKRYHLLCSPYGKYKIMLKLYSRKFVRIRTV